MNLRPLTASTGKTAPNVFSLLKGFDTASRSLETEGVNVGVNWVSRFRPDQ